MATRRITAIISSALVMLGAGLGVVAPAGAATRKAKHHKVVHHKKPVHHSGIPQNNGGDHDGDNNGGPSDGDGNV